MEQESQIRLDCFLQGADAWAVGIFAYELIIGVSPFKAKDKADTARNIICAQVWASRGTVGSAHVLHA